MSLSDDELRAVGCCLYSLLAGCGNFWDQGTPRATVIELQFVSDEMNKKMVPLSCQHNAVED